MKKVVNKFVDSWYRKPQWWNYSLLPFSYIFSSIVSLRRWLYDKEFFESVRAQVPVIIVGNVTVGGTGKTPLVIYLAQLLKQKGFRPGIVSRGYRSKVRYCQEVLPQSDPIQMGDESVLVARRTGCPVFIAPERTVAIEALLVQYSCDVIISDDGMQHYAMQRDIEVAVVDGERRLGNEWLLPAGPLRELPKRLDEVDFIVSNGIPAIREFQMQLKPGKVYNLKDKSKMRDLTSLAGKTVHAVAGIGYPKRFFSTLTAAGLKVIEHPFPDHYHFLKEDLKFSDNLPIIITEKDAIKCDRFDNENIWCLPITATLTHEFDVALLKRLNAIRNSRTMGTLE